MITEHRPGLLVLLDTGLGIERSDGRVLVTTTQQGRDAEQEQALYVAFLTGEL